MSLYVAKNNRVITMTRGDYFSFDVMIKSDNQWDDSIYVLSEGDILFFGLMEPNQPFEKAILKKQFGYDDYDVEGGTLKVVLIPEDTIELIPGTYYYQIKILYKDEIGDTHIDTIVQKTKFIIVD